LACLLFGWLWLALSPHAAFAFGAGCAVIAALLLRYRVTAEPPIPMSSAD
jgi:hypothetical protein